MSKKKNIKFKKIARDTKNLLKGTSKKRYVVYKGKVTEEDIKEIIRQLD